MLCKHCTYEPSVDDLFWHIAVCVYYKQSISKFNNLNKLCGFFLI